MPMTGLEPALGCPKQILNLPRLPFRHIGKKMLQYFKHICILLHQIAGNDQ